MNNNDSIYHLPKKPTEQTRLPFHEKKDAIKNLKKESRWLARVLKNGKPDDTMNGKVYDVADHNLAIVKKWCDEKRQDLLDQKTFGSKIKLWAAHIGLGRLGTLDKLVKSYSSVIQKTSKKPMKWVTQQLAEQKLYIEISEEDRKGLIRDLQGLALSLQEKNLESKNAIVAFTPSKHGAPKLACYLVYIEHPYDIEYLELEYRGIDPTKPRFLIPHDNETVIGLPDLYKYLAIPFTEGEENPTLITRDQALEKIHNNG